MAARAALVLTPRPAILASTINPDPEPEPEPEPDPGPGALTPILPPSQQPGPHHQAHGALLFGPVLFPHPHPRLGLGVEGGAKVIGATHRIAFSHCASGLQLEVIPHAPTATAISRALGSASLTSRWCVGIVFFATQSEVLSHFPWTERWLAIMFLQSASD